MVKHLLILLAGIFAAQFATSQETLTDLRRIGGAFDDQSSVQSTSRIDVLKHPFIYVIDTLELPFFDDFSTYRIKEYDANFDDPNVSLKINYDFSVKRR